LSKILEKPPNHDNKHYAFQALILKETLKPQNQTLKARETPIKAKTEKEGICGRYRHVKVGSSPTPRIKNKAFYRRILAKEAYFSRFVGELKFRQIYQ